MKASPDSPQTPDSNPDPITGEPGAHPVTTGVGAAAGGTAGLVAAAMVAGPVGVAAATIGGAIIGGYAGKAAGELIDPTAEDRYWREQHAHQPYAEPRIHDDDYYTAYRIGYVGYTLFGGQERSFDDAESDLRRAYEATGAHLPWDQARQATHAAWERVHRGEAHPAPNPTDPPATENPALPRESILSENLQSGALNNAQMPR